MRGKLRVSWTSAARPRPARTIREPNHHYCPGGRMATVTLRGNPVSVGGTFLKKGDAAPNFNLTGGDLKDVTLKDYAGKKKVISIVPSLDTPTCAKSTKVFNE